MPQQVESRIEQMSNGEKNLSSGSRQRAEGLLWLPGVWDSPTFPPALCFPLLSHDGHGMLGRRSSGRDTGKPS